MYLEPHSKSTPLPSRVPPFEVENLRPYPIIEWCVECKGASGRASIFTSHVSARPENRAFVEEAGHAQAALPASLHSQAGKGTNVEGTAHSSGAIRICLA